MNSTFGRDTLLLKHQSQPPKFEPERICVNGTESHKWPNLRWTLNSRSGAHAAISLTPRDTSRHRGLGCGGGGIRTHEGLSSLPVFKTGAFNHSATPPGLTRIIAFGVAARHSPPPATSTQLSSPQ